MTEWKSSLPQTLRLVAVLALAIALVWGANAYAGVPEYMKLKPRVGMGLEIKGEMNEDGVFVASDIELLPKERKPKLRGRIDAIDTDQRVIVVLGMRVRVIATTEFDAAGFGALTAGKHIEVKCDVNEDGIWEATRIETRDIKKSSKVKGTITDMNVDGTPPDTLSISGLKILLVVETDLERTSLMEERVEKSLLGDLAREDAFGMDGGVIVADGRGYFGAEYRHNVRSTSDYDLTQTFQSDREDTQPELRGNWTAFWSKHVRTFIEGRVRKNYVLSSDEELSSKDAEANITEAFVLVRGIAGRRLALQVGRQDFDEPREWLYDEYLDAVRLYYYGQSAFSVEGAFIHAVNPIKDKLETWTDYMGTVRWHPDRHNTVAAYVLRRTDSDENRKREPVWSGLRYLGDLRFRGIVVEPWLEAAIMRGEDKGEVSRGRAIDVGATVVLRRLPLWPTVTAGYAFASGDETGADDVDDTFRQTGYEDNNARMGGVASIRYYGAALDPELSNLDVFTVGGGLRPIRDSSLQVFYHVYRQDWPDDKVRGDLVDPPARPNGVDTDIGWGLDVVVAFPRLWNHVRASWTLGIFEPGDAYDPRQERAVLNKINLNVQL